VANNRHDGSNSSILLALVLHITNHLSATGTRHDNAQRLCTEAITLLCAELQQTKPINLARNHASVHTHDMDQLHKSLSTAVTKQPADTVGPTHDEARFSTTEQGCTEQRTSTIQLNTELFQLLGRI